MREKFLGLLKPTSEEVKRIWDDCIISLDANVLLNLYRYSDNTTDELVHLIKELKSKIWISSQAFKEFLENRYSVMHEQMKKYDEFLNEINKIERTAKETKSHPFLSENSEDELKKVFNKIKDELNLGSQRFLSAFKEDDILNKLEIALRDKIGDAFSSEELSEIYSEGEKRYEKQIPPGYEDSKIKKDTRQYSDFVIWKQLIEKSKSEKKPVIFITDDAKEDWWWIVKGKTIGPRPELVREFNENTNQKTLFYSSVNFIKYGYEYLEEKYNPSSLNEIDSIVKQQIENQKNEEEYIEIQNKLKEERQELFKLQRKLHTLKRSDINSDEKVKIYGRLLNEIGVRRDAIEELESKINRVNIIWI